MTSDGAFTYAYDSKNRLTSVSSNNIPVASFAYDARSRRVRKATAEAATTFFYDDWNLIEERIAYTNGTTSTIRYYWGNDLSGTLQGAGGIGGLLYIAADGIPYIPIYDSNGNVTRYLDVNGNTVAQYTYDAFGNTISKSGPLADFFRHRFSTKYCDTETGLYYYGYRYYSPFLMRWLNRDPIEEADGNNLYCILANNPIGQLDGFGCARYQKDNDLHISQERFVKMKSALERDVPIRIEEVLEPFKSAMLRHWKDIVVHFAGNSNPNCSGFEVDGYHERLGNTLGGSTLRDIPNRIVTFPNGDTIEIGQQQSWNSKVYICICRISNTQEAVDVVVHELAHAVGWGGPFVDDKDSLHDNLPPNMTDHPHQSYWNIPGKGYE
jgi:RHS repeat-associated protein